MARPQFSPASVETRAALERLKIKLETLDRNDVQKWVWENDDDFLVEEDVPMETWNLFVAMDKHPQDLRFKTLVWSAETVWLVEVTVSPWHEAAARSCDRVLDRQLDRLLAFTGSMTFYTPNEPTYEADSSYGPSWKVLGIQVPAGMIYMDWVTVIVEILYYQTWDSVHAKVDVYRRRAGVEYIICIKMSRQRNHWTYELYDVRDHIPAIPNMAIRHEFDVGTVNDVHVVELQTWRVLRLQQDGDLPPLPDGRVCPPTVQINIVDLANDVIQS